MKFDELQKKVEEDALFLNTLEDKIMINSFGTDEVEDTDISFIKGCIEVSRDRSDFLECLSELGKEGVYRVGRKKIKDPNNLMKAEWTRKKIIKTINELDEINKEVEEIRERKRKRRKTLEEELDKKITGLE